MVYVGRFNEEQIKNGTQKIEVEKKQKETGLNYVESKIVYKNKKSVGIDIWVCNAKEFTI